MAVLGTRVTAGVGVAGTAVGVAKTVGVGDGRLAANSCSGGPAAWDVARQPVSVRSNNRPMRPQCSLRVRIRIEI